MRLKFGIIALLLLILVSPVSAQGSFLDAQIAQQVAAMSLQHRVGQLFMVTLHGAGVTEVGSQLLREWQPGGITLFGANVGTPDTVTRLTNGYQQAMTEAGGPPLLIAIDFEGGTVERLKEGFTLYPVPMVVGAAGEAMAYRIGEAMAGELAAVGINMNLAPVADLETNPDNPIISRRTFGSDPALVGGVVAEMVRGMQSQNVLATVKHFPGHGETGDDSHAVLQTLALDRERLDAVELPPFQSAIDAGAAAVMVAHIHFAALDPDQRLPASLSPNVITGLLRGEMGYDGLVMTDALDMNAVDMEFEFTRAAIMAVQAGVDLLALGPSIGPDVAIRTMQAVLDAVTSGEVSEERLNESVTRILRAKQQFGLMDWTPLEPASAAARVNAEAHAQLIDELFREAVTVAYDRNNHIPITPDRRTAIIFLATRYQIQHECSTYDPNIRWVGVSDEPPLDEIGWAREAANWADTVVVFTQDAVRTPAQRDLVNALPPEKTVAVALLSPYDWLYYPQVSAYVASYSAWRPAVPAICAVLFGALPANGTFPLTLGPDLQAGSRAN